jgi:hypothetical protein
MNQITAIRNKVKLQEGSTKRGITAVITGVIVLYLVFKGAPADVDTLTQVVSSKVEFWIGVGLNAIGLLGIFIPDEPKTVKTELPPIELQSRPTLAAPAAHAPVIDDDPAPDRLHDHEVRTGIYSEPARPAKPTQPANLPDQHGWNG